MDQDKNPYLQTVIVAVLYVVTYLLVLKLLMEPWRLEAYRKRLRKFLYPPQELLSAAQEIAIRQFRTEISKWEHEQSTRDN
jgi:hypothetical protein